jgi:hypothetical protein
VPLPAPQPVTNAKPQHVRTLPKKTFVRRVNRICGALGPVADRKAVRRLRLRLVHLGGPARDRTRWIRVMSKLRAVENHLDTMQAAAGSGSPSMLALSTRNMRAARQSVDRRLRRFGAHACLS